MLLELATTILGELPQDLRFLYAFAVVFVLYIFIRIFSMFVDVIIDYLKSL